MIISKYSKSYDTTTNGSEQSFADPPRRGQSDGKAARQHWEDDGGPVDAPPPACAVERTSKPAWSVLSLRDLNEAIRLERCADNPVRLQHQAEQMERQKLRVNQVEQEQAAWAARAERNRDRNPWENT